MKGIATQVYVYSTGVEHLTASQEVPGSNPGVPCCLVLLLTRANVDGSAPLPDTVSPDLGESRGNSKPCH